MGDLNIIAEDLGYMTQEVYDFREKTGFPGMKILEFAFDPHGDSQDMPHYAKNNSVMYTGTHDNDTVVGWYENEADEETRRFMELYTNKREDESVPAAMLRTVYSSVSFMAIATMQDLLGLGSQARMNTPSTLGQNWVWRMTETQLNQEVEDLLTYLTVTYRRSNENLSN